jgi:hypothetical protein
MPVYTVSTNPKNIPGLKFWLDAADTSSLSLTTTTLATFSTVSNSTVYATNSSGPGIDWKNGTAIASVGYLTYSAAFSNITVLSAIKDKATGITLSADMYGVIPKSFGVIYNGTPTINGPRYLYNNINGKNTILFNYGTNSGGIYTLKSATVSNFSSATHSYYAVFSNGDIQGSTGSYLLSIYRTSRTTPTMSGYPNIGIYINGQYSQIIETTQNTTYTTSTPYLSINTPINVGYWKKVNIVSARLVGTGSNPIGRWSFKSRDENFTIYGKTASSNPTYISGSMTPVGVTISNAKITLGDYWPTSYSISSSTPIPPRAHFCEFLYYDRQLTDQEHYKVIQYLENKWIKPEEDTKEIQVCQFYKNFTYNSNGGGILNGPTLGVSNPYEINLYHTASNGATYGSITIDTTGEILPTGSSLYGQRLYCRVDILPTTASNGTPPQGTQRGMGIWFGQGGGYPIDLTRPPDFYIPPGASGPYEGLFTWGTSSVSNRIFIQNSSESGNKPWTGWVKIKIGTVGCGLNPS